MIWYEAISMICTHGKDFLADATFKGLWGGFFSERVKNRNYHLRGMENLTVQNNQGIKRTWEKDKETIW